MGITITIISSLLSGIIGVGISILYYRRYEKRQQQYEVLRRIVGYRFTLAKFKTEEIDAQFFSALNEVAILFWDSPEVIEAIKIFHRELNMPDRQNDNLITLFKEMCKVLNIKNTGLNDEFFMKPFSRGNTPNATVPVNPPGKSP